MPRRGENIFKRKDGRWEARYVKEITADKRKKYGSVYASTYTQVKIKRNEVCKLLTKEKKIEDFVPVNRIFNLFIFQNKYHSALNKLG